MTEGNKPMKKFRVGTVTATVWNNKVMKGDKEVEFKTVNLEKSYLDGETWKKSTSFTADDLPKVNLVLSQAYKFCLLKEE